MRILFVGDAHFRLSWPHSDLFEDQRNDERKEIENVIVEEARGSDAVVVLGDLLDARENHPSVLTDAAVFLNRLASACPKVAVIGGNHECYQDGTSALDVFEKTMGDRITFSIAEPKTVVWGGTVIRLQPYTNRHRLERETNGEAAMEIVSQIPEGTTILAAHHAFSGTRSYHGVPVDEFPEIIIPSDEALKRARYLVGGHIHMPSDSGAVKVVGSLMNHSFGEDSVHRLLAYDTDNDLFSTVDLPGRKLVKLTDPTEWQLKAVKDDSAVRVCLTEGNVLPPWFMPESLTVETAVQDTSLAADAEHRDDMSVRSLLVTYAEAKGIDINRLESAMASLE